MIAFEKLHNTLKGEVEKLITAAFQLPQIMHEAPGEAATAKSLPALFADEVLARFAPSFEAVVRAMPSSQLHAGWNTTYVLDRITRCRGDCKPKLPYVQLRFMNGWHMKDLLQTIATLLLQPTFFGSADVWSAVTSTLKVSDPLRCAAYLPSLEVADHRAEGTEQPWVGNVGPEVVRGLMVDTFCLFIEWYKLRDRDGICTRGLAELDVLCTEWVEQAKAVLGRLYNTTWKTHQCIDHAGASRRDLGNSSAQRSEHAHKFGKQLYEIANSKKAATFTSQLARARDLVVAAQVLKHRQTLSADAPSMAPIKQQSDTVSALVPMRKQQFLTLEFDQYLKVVDLHSSSMEIDQETKRTLLNECG
jgi:hypothetical protein